MTSINITYEAENIEEDYYKCKLFQSNLDNNIPVFIKDYSYGSWAIKDHLDQLSVEEYLKKNYSLVCRGDFKRVYMKYNNVLDIYNSYVHINLYGNSYFSATIIENNEARFNKLNDFLLSKLVPVKQVSAQSIYMFIQSMGGLDVQKISTCTDSLLLENYNKNIHKDINTTVKEIQSDSPQGRLFILTGSPGGGKTHLVKGICAQLKNCLPIILPVSLLEHLSGPGLIQSLVKIKGTYPNYKTIFIIEDADELLLDRDKGGNFTKVSELLNLSDGIIGQALDIRILATTNRKSLELDKAITRSGRLNTLICIEDLLASEANAILKRLIKDKTYMEYISEDTTPIMLSEVYQKASKINNFNEN